MAWDTPASQTTGDLITVAIWNQNVVNNPTALITGQVSFEFDGGGAAISTDAYKYTTAPYKLVITAAELQAETVGDLVVDIWSIATASDYSSSRPANTDSICASAPPTLSCNAYVYDATLTGWTKTVAANSPLTARVESAAAITHAFLNLKYSRSS